MERHEVEGVRLEIDRTRRFVHLSFPRPELVAPAAAAQQFCERLEEWLSAEPGPLRVLVDCSNVRNSEAGWRAEFGRFFKRHREEAHMAWYNATPLIRITIRMFILATGVDGAAFATEAEARAYLGLEDAET